MGHSRIDLEWDPPAYDGGAPISGYRIEISADRRRTWTLLARRGANTTSYYHTALPPNTTRHYRVSAVNRAGAGLPSNVDFATTDADLPGAPTGLEAEANGTSRIDLTWTAPSYTGGVPLIGYRIEVSQDAGRSWSELVPRTQSATTAYSHTGLRAGSTRHYRVSAINHVGAGAPSGGWRERPRSPRFQTGRRRCPQRPMAPHGSFFPGMRRRWTVASASRGTESRSRRTGASVGTT